MSFSRLCHHRAAAGEWILLGREEHGHCLKAAWLNEVVVRAVALLSALTKEFRKRRAWPGTFRGPSRRAPFSDEGSFTFSEALFEGTLHEGLKRASPSEGFKEGLHLRKKGFEGGLKGASRRGA